MPLNIFPIDIRLFHKTIYQSDNMYTKRDNRGRTDIPPANVNVSGIFPMVRPAGLPYH